jgi:hypothetical protein
MFRDLSQAVCGASIRRLSGLKSAFQPLMEPSLPGLDVPVQLRCTIIGFANLLPYLRLRPRWHAIEENLFQRPHVIRQARRHRRCARPPQLS